MSNIQIILYSYLGLNFILSVISRILVEKADEYWRKYEDAPTNIVSGIFIFCTLFLSEKIAWCMGYILRYYSGFMGYDKIPCSTKSTKICLNILTPLFSILLFIPILVYAVGYEIHYRYFHKGDN